MLFEWHVTICLSLSIVSLIWFCMTLKRGALRYQFSRFGFAILMGLIVSLNCISIQFFSQVGVFWMLFMPLVIAGNDAFAYFCGKTFGRTPLIKLSPNKTLEGFLGGGLFTLMSIFLFTSTIFHYRGFVCINYKINWALFKGVECEATDSSIFMTQHYTWPLYFDASPALLTCAGFGVFASLVSPFAGFLASGMKRAWQIKDFSNSLPGHGGFLDRFDCTIFANIFMLGLLSQVLYKEYLQMDKVAARFTELDSAQQTSLL